MEAPIFPSCSYLVILAASTELRAALLKASAPFQVHLLFCAGVSEVEKVSQILSRVTGYIAFAAAETADLERIAKLAEYRGAPYLHVPSPEPAPAESLRQTLGQFLGGMVPKGLSRVLVESANAIFPTFFKNSGGFAEVEPLTEGFDRQVTFSMVGGDLIGSFITRVNTAQIATAGETKERVDLVAQEASNQCLGLVGQSLAKIGIQTRVGLPTLFNLTRIPEIRTLAFFPSVHVADAAKQIYLSLGFLNLIGEPLFDLSGVDSSGGGGDIEFL